MSNADVCTATKNEREFDECVKSKKKVYALIYATWCPYCMRFLPIFQRFAQENPGPYLLAQDDQETLQDRYDVDVIPTVLCFEDGRLTKRLDGQLGVGLTESQLAKFIPK